MSMFGVYGGGKKFIPHVLHISISRYDRNLPAVNETLQFLVSLHQEGTGISWQHNVAVSPEDERFFLNATHELYLWSVDAGLTPQKAQERIDQLGRKLYDIFIGPEGERILDAMRPTAILLNIDETILNLPWELIGKEYALAQRIPFGRLVTTRMMPRPARDPLQEDDVVRILAVANPTLDLVAGDREIAALQQLVGKRNTYSIEVDVLSREQATRSAFIDMLADGDYDILHFAGHGSFDPEEPENSAVHFADGLLTAYDVLNLKWKAPPYLVFNSACESGRAAGGKRLVSNESHSNGLAAAFIAAGATGYAGYYWPVTEIGAEHFTKEFYDALFFRENVGIAFLAARSQVADELREAGVSDLTNLSAVLYGDAASEHRLDWAKAI